MNSKYTAHKKKLYEEIIDQFSKLLQSGKYEIGDKLPSLPELGELFQVGKPALREALSVLASTGVLEVRHGKGVYIKRLTLEPVYDDFVNPTQVKSVDINHWLEFRCGIEVQAAGLAAERRTQEELDAIEKVSLEIEKKYEQGELAEELDYEFHILIAAATHNPLFLDALQTETHIFQQRWFQAARQSVALNPSHEIIIKEHRKILECIRKGDAEKARQAMQKHVINAQRQLRLFGSLGE